MARINPHGVGTSALKVYRSASGDDFILIELGDKNGRFETKELLEVIYREAPSHAPDGWKPTPKWADARVVEGVDSEGDRRFLVRHFSGKGWITDTGIDWGQADAERGLTDVRILIGADDD